MAISPGTYNTTLQRRADFALDLQFKDGNSNPIDLTGWTAIAQALASGLRCRPRCPRNRGRAGAASGAMPVAC